jgi:hypothetical protein
MTRPQQENQKEIIVSDLIDLFKRQSENWGDQFGRVLETLLRAHIDLNIHNSESNTLLDVFECVTRDDALTDLINRTTDQVIREQLVRIKEDMSSYEMEPLQRRLNDFVMNETVRHIIAAETSGIDFRQAMDAGKIILVDIQKGEVGDTVAKLVGSIVITKIWAAAQSRITIPVDDRQPFYLYVDELQNFAGEGSNFTKILSEAREYRLGCWLATQYLEQLATEMRRAVTNNCRTKIVFNPADSEDANRIAGMLRGISKTQLQALGTYRAVMQAPAEQQHNDAVAFDTYPPWDADRDGITRLKQQATAGTTSPGTVKVGQSLGAAANAGSDTHQELLAAAKQHLEQRDGVTVNLLYQDSGADQPDGHVMTDDAIRHLEAERSTVSKPVKVLRNVERAADADRDVVFAVEQGDATRLQQILEDPVNRRGSEHEDDHGTFSYYTDEDGDPFTATDVVDAVDWEVLVRGPEGVYVHDAADELECPMLADGDATEDELEAFCLHRDEDGFCSKLEAPCVVTADD